MEGNRFATLIPIQQIAITVTLKDIDIGLALKDKIDKMVVPYGILRTEVHCNEFTAICDNWVAVEKIKSLLETTITEIFNKKFEKK